MFQTQFVEKSKYTFYIQLLFFPKIVTFMRYCRKIWCRQRGRRWQYGGTLHAGLVRLHARKHTPSPLQQQPRTHVHSTTSARARTHTRVILLLFHGNKRASVLRYTVLPLLFYFNTNL